MAATTLFTNQEAVFPISAAGSDGTARPAGFSAQISDYTVAYVALVGAGGLHVVPKKAGAASVTISGHSQDGTALPPQTLDFTFADVPPPQADHFVVGAVTVRNQDIITPADPGTDTVTGNV